MELLFNPVADEIIFFNDKLTLGLQVY